MLDQHIQKLGRWTFKAFQLYFEPLFLRSTHRAYDFKPVEPYTLLPKHHLQLSHHTTTIPHPPHLTHLWAQNSLWALNRRFLQGWQ